MQAVLVVEQGRLKGQQRWIQRNQQLSVGGSAWADFVVDEDANLSPIHFMISLTDEGCLLYAINDSATYVNGDEVYEARLRNGDRVRAGNLEFVVQLNGFDSNSDRRRVDIESRYFASANAFG